MSEVREAMVVAGGAGTRLWPLTATRPKPLLELCGAPFLTGVIRRLAAIGVRRVLLVVGSDPAPFTILDDAAAAAGVELACVPEPEPLDTAGGVRAALDQVSGTFLVLNGDILTDLDLAAPIAAHHAAAADATLTLTRVADTSAFGVCVLEGTRIVGFVEKPAPGTLPGQDTVNAGCYVLEPDAIGRFPAARLSFERQVFPELVRTGAHVEGYVSDAFWADLGTPRRYLDGHRGALDGALAWPVLDDVPADPLGIRRGDGVEIAPDAVLRAPVLLGAGAVVGAGARVGPHAVLGPHTRIGEGAVVCDSVLGAGTHVEGGVALDGVIGGEGVHVGRDVVATDGAVLGDGVQVPPGTRLEPDARVAVEVGVVPDHP